MVAHEDSVAMRLLAGRFSLTGQPSNALARGYTQVLTVAEFVASRGRHLAP